MTTALFVAAGYLVGSVPFGYWLVRALEHVDIRTVGSGNIGASNVWRAYGWRFGVPVMLFDLAKGLVPALVATQVAGALAGVLTGGAAMLGHARPIFLGFAKGGKAVATAGGAFLGVAPVVGLIAAGAWIAVFALTRYASVASMVAACSLPLLAWGLGEPWPVIVFGGAAAGTVIALHRQNIRRLVAGGETRAKPWRQQLRAVTARAAPSSGRTP
ncbi:MAG TPA: glycerol-3-phosphate 1-O-acyltransferase PlsY [Gaiellaceae bacterium]|nr:glycerol-3-phosphate 1-O-acyltransferase PlsY [Gaiellaceae bacterium]